MPTAAIHVPILQYGRAAEDTRLKLIHFILLNQMELYGLPSTLILPPAVTLTFDLLIQKSNKHIYKPKYICGQNWVKFPSLVCEIWCSQVFRVAQTH